MAPALSLQVICDLTITASMVYYLHTRCTRVKQCVDLTVWYAIILMTAVFCRTIAAMTELVYYSLTSGAVALFVP